MKLIAYDLGTGGVKASLYNEQMETLAKSFIEYETLYPAPDHHEQRPADWWAGVIASTRNLLERTGTAGGEIAGVGLSGHSLVAVPIGEEGDTLAETVPIWSDKRAVRQAADFFRQVDERQWYLTTGNGFPPACYALFKLMWMRENQPELFRRTRKVLGSKDYINYRLTGRMATDPSYASGCGAYDLAAGALSAPLLEAAGIPAGFFPPIVPAHQVVGRVSRQAAAQTGLAAGTPVACGGVDNACMALGAVGCGEGRVYTSLGSSSWIPVNAATPVLDADRRPYVFAHLQEDMFTSAYSIFSSSLRWAREALCQDIAEEQDAYRRMDALAATAQPGAGGILFNPSLAGGTSQDKSVHIRGAFLGLHLGVTRADLIRAVMEGIAMNLRLSLDYLREKTALSNTMLFTGGGSKSPFWMQMFADVFEMEIIKTNIDQDAASLGAAAAVARATGLWADYSGIDSLHRVEARSTPDPASAERYRHLLPVFRQASGMLAEFGDKTHSFNN